MSKAFDILSSALDEAIENSRAEEKFLREETLSIEIEPLVEYTADDIYRPNEMEKKYCRVAGNSVSCVEWYCMLGGEESCE